MRTTIRAGVLPVFLVWLAWPAAAHAQFVFTTNSDHTFAITGYTGSGGEVIIPATNDERSVTRIGDEAFHDCACLTGVTLPASILSIGEAAFFGCCSLTNAVIPNSVTNIDDEAFAGCGLIRVTIPDSVTSIGNGAFRSCSNLTSVAIENGITNIGNMAFLCCARLSTLTLGSKVTDIGYCAFYKCDNLAAVYCAGNAPSLLGSAVFKGVRHATIYHLPETTGWTSTFGGQTTATWTPQTTNDVPASVIQKHFPLAHPVSR